MRSGWSRIVDWRSKRRERAEVTVTRLRPISPGLLLLAVVVIVAVTWPLTRWLYGIAGDDPARRIEAIKTGLTIAAGTGGVFALLLAFRRQRSTEIIATETREAREREYEQRDRAADASERDAEQRRITELYTKAADQLGHEKAAVRLAGVYAMARVADNWDEQRQVCIDVLCAYLRMPYEPDTASEKHREGEREVRLTIIRIIRDHLQDPSAPTTWCGRDLDFTNAMFDGGDFTGAKFTGGKVSFDGAKFTGGVVSFDTAEFTGGDVSFAGAEFISGNVSFNHAKFTDGNVLFNCAKFTGGEVSFEARFNGGSVSFLHAKFISSSVSFGGAKFTGSEVSFLRAEFTGGKVNFSFAEFASGDIFFDSAEFIGGDVFFGTAKYIGGDVSFDDAEYTGWCSINWGPFEPPAAWTALQERERRQNEPPT